MCADPNEGGKPVAQTRRSGQQPFYPIPVKTSYRKTTTCTFPIYRQLSVSDFCRSSGDVSYLNLDRSADSQRQVTVCCVLNAPDIRVSVTRESGIWIYLVVVSSVNVHALGATKEGVRQCVYIYVCVHLCERERKVQLKERNIETEIEIEARGGEEGQQRRPRGEAILCARPLKFTACFAYLFTTPDQPHGKFSERPSRKRFSFDESGAWTKVRC